MKYLLSHSSSLEPLVSFFFFYGQTDIPKLKDFLNWKLTKLKTVILILIQLNQLMI